VHNTKSVYPEEVPAIRAGHNSILIIKHAMKIFRKKHKSIASDTAHEPGQDAGHPQHYISKKTKLSMIIVLGVLIAASILCLILFRANAARLLQAGSKSSSYTSHYVFVGDINDEFSKNIYEAAASELSSRDAYLEYTGQDLETSYGVSDLMKMATYSRADGIFVVGDGTDGMTDQINNAVNHGIPVICVGGDCYGSLRQSYVGVTYYEFGQRMAQMFLADTRDQASREKMNVLILTSPEERNTNQNLIISGIRDYIQNNYLSFAYSIQSYEVGDGSLFTDVESINQLFESGHLPDILLCLDESTTNHVCQAVVDSNHVGDVTIYGSFTNDTILNALRKKIISGVLTVSPEEIGKKAAESMTEYKDSGFVTEYSTIDIQSVTPDNVDKYTYSKGERQ
jgi:ribose transport system substrate-binding protein